MNASNKPTIGIVGWSTGDNSFGATKAYLHYLSFFGNVRILTPRSDIDQDLDLVVMPGGKDTLPSKYNQVPGYYNSDPDQFKEHFYNVNLKQYVEAGIPIFGICLGFQMLCTYFGGELTQNIDLGAHGYSDEKNAGRGELVNDLIFDNKFIALEANLMRDNKLKKIKVCSLHHQGIMIDDMPDDLEVIAKTKDDVVEFMRHRKFPIAGCQNHPEEDFNPLSIYMIKALIKKSPNLKNENQGTPVTVEGQHS
jgi:gamma-glutamyl-gamma-aminobutyrate hydrolase PuuD